MYFIWVAAFFSAQVDQPQLAAQVGGLFDRQMNCRLGVVFESPGTPPALKYRFDIEILRSGDRLKTIETEETLFQDPRRKKRIDQTAEHYADAGKSIVVIHDARDRKKAAATTAQLDGLSESDRSGDWALVPHIAFGNAFYGYPLAEIVRDASGVSEIAHDGRRVLKVESKSGKWGRFELLLDPANSMMPVHLINWKGRNDLTPSGKRLSEFDNGAMKIKEWRKVIDEIRVGSADGRPVILGYRSRVFKVMEDGSEHAGAEESASIEGWNFAALPSNAFEFSCTRPDGLLVTVWDRPTILHEWQGGEIVKLNPAPAVARLQELRGYEVRPGDVTAYFLSAGVFLVFLAALLVWRWRETRAGAG